MTQWLSSDPVLRRPLVFFVLGILNTSSYAYIPDWETEAEHPLSAFLQR